MAYTVGANGSSSNHWIPNDILDIENQSLRYALIILNRPIELDAKYMESLWNKAVVRITVDGGTDRWFNWAKSYTESSCKSCKTLKMPDLITGDMDSISPTLLDKFLKQSGPPEVIRTPDQSETDFTKSLIVLSKYLSEKNITIDNVISLAETSGRIDQIMSNLNTLFKAQKHLGDMHIFQLASNSISWLLPPGKHRIEVPQYLRDDQLWCSLVPIAGKCENTVTTGLKWNLENRSMEFGDMVSTSNSYNGDPEVTVNATNYILWSMGLVVESS